MSDIVLRPEVQWFAEQMEIALRANEHKGGWQRDADYELFARLREESEELREVLAKRLASAWLGNIDDVVKESSDIANFAMMIADNAMREKVSLATL